MEDLPEWPHLILCIDQAALPSQSDSVMSLDEATRSTQLKQVACIVPVYINVEMAVLTLVAQQPNPNYFFFFCLVLPIATIPFILLCLALLFWYIKYCQPYNVDTTRVNRDRNHSSFATGIISLIVLLLGFQAAVLMYAYYACHYPLIIP